MPANLKSQSQSDADSGVASTSGRQLINAKRTRTKIGGVSSMTLHRRRKSNDFPKPVLIDGRNYWDEAEVDVWIESRLANRREG